MMPNEAVPIGPNRLMDAYLAEGRSIVGLSGSPVFVRETLQMAVHDGKKATKFMGGLGQIHFLGLMHGHWDVPVNFEKEQVEAVNIGISLIVPAKRILEVLYPSELVQIRKDFDARIKNYRAEDKASEKPLDQAEVEANVQEREPRY